MPARSVIVRLLPLVMTGASILGCAGPDDPEIVDGPLASRLAEPNALACVVRGRAGDGTPVVDIIERVSAADVEASGLRLGADGLAWFGSQCPVDAHQVLVRAASRETSPPNDPLAFRSGGTSVLAGLGDPAPSGFESWCRNEGTWHTLNNQFGLFLDRKNRVGQPECMGWPTGYTQLLVIVVSTSGVVTYVPGAVIDGAYTVHDPTVAMCDGVFEGNPSAGHDTPSEACAAAG